MNHAEIGALIAERWNFPESLVNAIRFHHDPGSAPENDKDLVEAVYLSNMFCEYENGNVIFDQFEPSVLRTFGISSKKQMDSLLARFSLGFSRETRIPDSF
jgi:HD-like signal output (HDOD) protein